MKSPVYTYHLIRNSELDNIVHIYIDGEPCYHPNGSPVLADRERILETIVEMQDKGKR